MRPDFRDFHFIFTYNAYNYIILFPSISIISVIIYKRLYLFNVGLIATEQAEISIEPFEYSPKYTINQSITYYYFHLMKVRVGNCFV